MNKFRNLKLIGLVCIFTFTLVIIGFQFVQAKGEPKGKPKPVYWSAIIPEEPMPFGNPNMLYSDPPGEEIFSNGDTISVRKLGYSPSACCQKGGKGFYYQINFWIHGPDYLAGFQGVELYPLSIKNPDPYPDYPGPPCKFPADYLNDCALHCLECFLNNLHPHPEYTLFNIRFMIYDFEIEDMIVTNPDTDPPVHLGDVEGVTGSFGFSVYYSSEYEPDVLYHNVYAYNREDPDSESPRGPLDGLYIQRTADNVWRIFVDHDLYVKETYRDYEEYWRGKSLKTRKVIRVPLAGTAHFNFMMDWTKYTVD